MKEINLKKNNYFFVSYQKEISDIQKLCNQIKESNWIDNNTIIVNCSPDYSSTFAMQINHKLSYLNNNELFERIDLEMPYPIMNQVWNVQEKKYETYDQYLKYWSIKHLDSVSKYLFLDSGTIRGSNFEKLRLSIRGKIEPEQYRFGTLYKEKNSIFKPDFFVEEYDFANQGGLLFEWENSDNPNWNY
jgi:hypothetical protein